MGKIFRKLTCLVLVLSVITISMPFVFAEDSDVDVDVVDADTIEEYGDAISDLVDYQHENITGEPTDEAQDDEFFSCRLIVKSYCIKKLDLERFEPAAIVYNETDDGATIQFDTREQTKACLEALNADPRVEYAETDKLIKIPEHSDGDIVFPKENLRNTVLSWGVGYSNVGTFVDNLVASGNNTPVVVSVVDTGVYASHSYLQGRILGNGYDFAYGDSNPYDGDGHGTHVSGTIVDVTGDLNVKILPVKVLDDTGSGYTSSIMNGVNYAVEHGANVINMSLGGGHDSDAFDQAVNNAVARGVTVCVAAGNESSRTEYCCPAHIHSAICVAAIDSYGDKANFSNFGGQVDIAAPGVSIYSSYTGGGYETLSGTSMATPHVAGFCAIIKAMYPTFTPKEIEQTLINACDDLGEQGWDMFYGYGKVNFDKVMGNHEHVAGDWQLQSAATCTDQALYVKLCTECKMVMDSYTTPALGHNYEQSWVEPTCLGEGYTKNLCTRCGDIKRENIVSALGHDWAEPNVIREVTCTKNGLIRTTCKRCGDKVDEIVYATGHNYQVTHVDRACNTAGYDLHTCTKCGESFMTDYVAAYPHTPGDWEVKMAPTCAWDGTEVRICSVCGEVAEQRSIPKSGHSYEVSVVEPTCTSGGYTKYTCTICSSSYKEDVVDKLGHDYQDENMVIIKAPTCIAQGAAFVKCSRCNTRTQKKIPVSDHTPGEWEVATPATTETEGLKVRKCTVCDAVLESETIPVIECIIGSKGDSGTVIDEERGVIYGVEEGVQSLENYVETVGCEIEYVPTENGFGTGTTVNLVSDGEVIKSYKLVIFGDVDGDGYCDGCDYVLMSLYINWQYTFDDCCLLAADITNDGYVDAFDLSLSSLSGVQLYSAQQVRKING
ncbi:MAG: S8 family serine peptidase [Clostridia bacterium]|nr:S8 family serine peptidase [Clostridia bacterium]